MNYLEIIGTLTGLIYLYLEYRASAWLWFAGVVMPAIYLRVYYDAGLYADLGISIYYIIASVYGWICWMKGRHSENKENGSEKAIARTPASLYVPLLAVFSAIFIILGITLANFTDSTVPWADAFTTALSIVAMWMLAKKYLEQWLVWIVADVACAILYVYKDLWFTGGLYLLYAVIAVFGYRKWRKMM